MSTLLNHPVLKRLATTHLRREVELDLSEDATAEVAEEAAAQLADNEEVQSAVEEIENPATEVLGLEEVEIIDTTGPILEGHDLSFQEAWATIEQLEDAGNTLDQQLADVSKEIHKLRKKGKDADPADRRRLSRRTGRKRGIAETKKFILTVLDSRRDAILDTITTAISQNPDELLDDDTVGMDEIKELSEELQEQSEENILTSTPAEEVQENLEHIDTEAGMSSRQREELERMNEMAEGEARSSRFDFYNELFGIDEDGTDTDEDDGQPGQTQQP